jgi:hypothetical protein
MARVEQKTGKLLGFGRFFKNRTTIFFSHHSLLVFALFACFGAKVEKLSPVAQKKKKKKKKGFIIRGHSRGGSPKFYAETNEQPTENKSGCGKEKPSRNLGRVREMFYFSLIRSCSGHS